MASKEVGSPECVLKDLSTHSGEFSISTEGSLVNAESKEFGIASYKQGLAEGYAILETWIKERIEHAVSDTEIADALRVKFDMLHLYDSNPIVVIAKRNCSNPPTTEGK